MSKIKAVTNDNKLIITARPEITSGSRNVDELSVVFDKSWNFDSAFFYVNFYIDGASDGIIRRLEMTGSTGRCILPEYITEKDGFFHFGVFVKADDDIIKTSDIAGYEIKRGICISPDGDEHDRASELKRRFIELMNANSPELALNTGMRFEDIDLSYTTFMSQLYGRLNAVNEYSEALYSVIKEYIDPTFEKIADSQMAYIIYFVTLEDYLRTHTGGFNFDGESTESQEIIVLKSSLYEIITTYIDEDFDAGSELSLYSSAIEDFCKYGQLSAENNEKLYESLNELYTQGEEE